MKHWIFSPHSGGKPIPPPVQEQTTKRILHHANAHYAGTFSSLQISFRGKFCYIDAFREPALPTKAELHALGETKDHYLERLRATPTHLCRLRYVGENKWSVAFYSYSHERYEPSMFHTGEFFGTPEDVFDVGAIYLSTPD